EFGQLGDAVGVAVGPRGVAVPLGLVPASAVLLPVVGLVGARLVRLEGVVKTFQAAAGLLLGEAAFRGGPGLVLAPVLFQDAVEAGGGLHPAVLHALGGPLHRPDGLVEDVVEGRAALELLLQARRFLGQALLGVHQARPAQVVFALSLLRQAAQAPQE